MRVIAQMSWGSIDLGEWASPPMVGDWLYSIDGKKDGRVRQRVFRQRTVIGWMNVRTVWQCVLSFEGDP